VLPTAESYGRMANRLESACALIEAGFVDASDVLSDAVNGIAALVAALDSLTQVVGDEAIAATTQQLAAAATRLSALQADQAARRADIAMLEDLRMALSSDVEDMRRSLAYMRAFTVSIKITAGGIASLDPAFPTFALEACLRVESGCAELDGLEGYLLKLKKELQKAAPRVETLVHGSGDMIASVPAQLVTSAELLAKRRGQIAAAAAEAVALARDVRKKVSRILGALQIGDSTRQRVEHIQAGIKLLEKNDPALAPEAAARSRALLCALLTVQLDSTLTDFNNEVAEIGSGLAGLARDAAALLNRVKLDHGKASGEAEGFMAQLAQRVAAAAALVAEIEGTDALARDTGREAAATAQALSDRLSAVQTMKADVLFMALNTTLRSARLGEHGRPLGIIASELRVHAGHLDRTATASMATLKTLIETAAGLSRDSGGPGEGAGAALQAAIACIDGARQTTDRDVPGLVSQGDAVLQFLVRSTQRLDFQKEIGGVLGEVARDLAAHAASAAECGPDIQAPAAARFAEMAAIYTMAKEREIHAAVAANWGVAIPAPPARPAGAATDVFEDELF